MADGVNVRDVGGGVVSPAGYIIRTGIRVLSGSHGARGPNQDQRDRFRAAGGTIEVLPGKGNPRAYYWQGVRISGPEATRISQGYRPGTAPIVVPTPPPPAPGPIILPSPDYPAPAAATSTARSWAPWLFQYGRGPRTRFKRKKKRAVNPFLPRAPADIEREILKRVPQMPAGQWDDMVQGFVGPVPSIPDILPRVVTRALPRIAVGVLSRVLWLPGLILFPSETSSDDVIRLPQPSQMPQGVPRGPRTRPTRRVKAPYDPEYPVGPVKVPEHRPDDQPRDVPTRLPHRLPQPYSIPRPWPIPRAPTPAPRPSPRPGTVPKPPPKPDWWPYLVPVLQAIPRDQPGRVRFSRPRDRPLQSPLDQPLELTQPVPQRADQCDCTETKRKRKKKGCTNPITGKRTFSRGGAKFRTITRKLQCQA